MPASKKENPLKAFLVSLVFPALYFLLLTFVPAVPSLIYQNILGLGYEAYSALYDIWFMCSVAVFFLIVIAVFKFRRRSLLKRIQSGPMPGRMYAMVAALTLGAMLISGLFNYAFPQNLIDVYMNNTAVRLSGWLVVSIIATGLVAPLGEETAFRGLMMTRLQGRMAPWLAVTLSALVFAFIHAGGSVFQAFAALPLAFIICLVYLWVKNIRATILLHIINNTFSVVVAAIAPVVPAFSVFNPGNTSMQNLIISLAGLVVAVIMLGFIYKYRVRA